MKKRLYSPLAMIGFRAYIPEMQNTPHNPHDALFKEYFGRRDVAAHFLQQNLPAHVAEDIDFSTIKSESESFIGSELERYFADLVFSCRRKDGREASVYLLLEHKSAPAYDCAFQLLEYMLQLWKRWRNSNQKALPPPVVIPMVIYHGKKPWNGLQLSDIFNETVLGDYIPGYRMEVYDLSAIPEKEIQGELEHKAVLLLWKAMHSPTPFPEVMKLLELLYSTLESDNVIKTIELFLRYVMAVDTSFTPERVEKELGHYPEGEKIMRNLAEEFAPFARKKGMEEGLKLGREEGQEQGKIMGVRSTLFLLARTRFGTLPMELIGMVEAIEDLDSLNRLSTSLVTVGTLEEFQGVLERVLQEQTS